MDISVVMPMTKTLQNFKHFSAFFWEFFLKFSKAKYLYVYRSTNYIGKAIPKGRPIFAVVIGKIKYLFENRVHFAVVLNISEIKNIRVSVFVHCVLLYCNIS